MENVNPPSSGEPKPAYWDVTQQLLYIREQFKRLYNEFLHPEDYGMTQLEAAKRLMEFIKGHEADLNELAKRTDFSPYPDANLSENFRDFKEFLGNYIDSGGDESLLPSVYQFLGYMVNWTGAIMTPANARDMVRWFLEHEYNKQALDDLLKTPDILLALLKSGYMDAASIFTKDKFDYAMKVSKAIEAVEAYKENPTEENAAAVKEAIDKVRDCFTDAHK